MNGSGGKCIELQRERKRERGVRERGERERGERERGREGERGGERG